MRHAFQTIARFERSFNRAERREEYAAGYSPSRLDAVIEALRPYAGARVADLGSGLGHVVACASMLGCDAIGVEWNPSLADQSRKLLRKLERHGELNGTWRILTGSYLPGAGVLDFAEPEVFYLYGWPQQVEMVIPAFVAHARPHARLLVMDYRIPDALLVGVSSTRRGQITELLHSCGATNV